MATLSESQAQLSEEVHELRARLAALERERRESAQTKGLLRESDAQNRALLEGAVDGIITLDERGTVRALNPAAERLFGYTAEQVVGHNVKMLMPPPYDENHDEHIDHYLRTNEKRIIGTIRQVEGKRQDGTTFPLELSVSEIVAGRERRFLGILHDVSKRERAEKESARLATALEATAEAVFITDVDGTIQYVNPAFECTYGYTSEEAIGQNPRMLKSGRHDRAFYSSMWQTLKRGQTWYACFVNKRKDGTLIDVESTITPVKDASRTTTGYVAVLRDITQRKQTEEALKEREQHFRLFSLSTGDCFWNWDMVAGTVERSSGIERSFGYPEQEILPGPEWWADRIHPEDRESVSKVFDAAISGDQTTCGCEYRFRCRNGSYAVIDEHFCLIRDATGKAVRSLGVMRDITTRKRAEEEKSLLEEQLHQSQKMDALGQLASGIAHDFNNLLMVVRNCADFLDNNGDLDGPAPKEALSLIMGATAQASAVTRSLLAFAGKGATTRMVVDLGSIVDNFIVLMRHLLPVTIEIVVDLPESPLWVLGGESQLQQVLMNLAINSRDAMPDGGTMSITVDELDGTARVTVTDTGVGIAPELQSRIFEPFFSTKPSGDGIGLGLAIVHGIVKDHQGEIRVQSELGEGTTTTISLPRVQEPAPDAVSIPSEIPRGQGQLVVLAEDGQQVRMVTKLLLVGLGYEVELAEDGPEAMARFHKKRDQAELLILDMNMPKMTGVQCLEELRADGVDTPILLITAGPGLQRAGDSLDGRTRILLKPFDRDDLGRAIAELLSPSGSAE